MASRAWRWSPLNCFCWGGGKLSFNTRCTFKCNKNSNKESVLVLHSPAGRCTGRCPWVLSRRLGCTAGPPRCEPPWPPARWPPATMMKWSQKVFDSVIANDATVQTEVGLKVALNLSSTWSGFFHYSLTNSVTTSCFFFLILHHSPTFVLVSRLAR